LARVDIFFEKYYTDQHHVDEDLTTVIDLGGAWPDSIQTGVAFRTIDNTSSVARPYIASRQKINRTYSPSGDACFSFDKR
jgi:hypothetical protein